MPELLNVRSGPGLTYDIVTTVPAGTQATIVGIDPDDDWYLVEIDGVEGQVWIYQGLTTLVGSLAGVKQYTALEIAQLTGTPGSDGSVPLAITVPITMNVRTGPGLTYDVVRIVPAGTQGRIFGIDPDDDWFQIELEGLDTLVWALPGPDHRHRLTGRSQMGNRGRDRDAAGRDHATGAIECPRRAGPDL